MKRKPTRKDLLIVISRLQQMIGYAKSKHGNDRDQFGFEDGQRTLGKAFNLCIEAVGQDPQVSTKCGPWGEPKGGDVGFL